MTTYEIDDARIDLDRVHCDAIGVEWEWTGTRDAKGAPLMQAVYGPSTPVPLPDVHDDHGPLIPVAHCRPDALWLRVLTVPTPADLLRGAA
ncbi:phiSA1p31-related protein [Streptomyces sp. LZ34]